MEGDADWSLCKINGDIDPLLQKNRNRKKVTRFRHVCRIFTLLLEGKIIGKSFLFYFGDESEIINPEKI